jgi:mRNA interferase HigB
MHVISQKALRDFWEVHPNAEVPLRAWFRNTQRADWQNFNDVRGAYGSADLVGKCVIFNIGGNKFRLIVVIHYDYGGRVYVRHVLTHKEYDKGAWKKDCAGPKGVSKTSASKKR